MALQAVSNWRNTNLFTFNSTKTQACLFSTKQSRAHLAPTFRGVSVPLTDSSLVWSFQPTSISSPKHRLHLKNFLKTPMRPGGISLRTKWSTAATFGMVQPNQLAAVDSIEKRVKRLISDPALIDTNLQTLEHRCKVARLSVFYRIHFAKCAKELHDLIPQCTFRHRDKARPIAPSICC